MSGGLADIPGFSARATPFGRPIFSFDLSGNGMLLHPNAGDDNRALAQRDLEERR
jgi:hypothetical protein